MIAFFAAAVFGQSSGATTGAIVGTVKDTQNGIIVGATVTVKDLDTNLERSARVGENGQFSLPKLSPGKYQLTVQAEGFDGQMTHITLNVGVTALIEFILKVGASNNFVEVNTESSIGAEKTESSTNIQRQAIDSLPINRRDFLDFTVLAARVIADRVPALGLTASSGFSVNGQSGHFNSITIDGLDNVDYGSGSARSTYSQDAVQEFQIVSDGFSAEFGRSLAGAVNIVTRSGGNDYHGKLFLFNRNDNTSARNAFMPLSLPFAQYQFGASLSGPIKRDKDFFFLSFERLSIQENNNIQIKDKIVASARQLGFNISNGPQPFSIGTTSALARVDLQLTPNDKLFLRYNGGFTYNGDFEAVTSQFDTSNAAIQRLQDNSIATSNIYINAPLNLINETRFLFGRRNQNIVSPTDGVHVQIAAFNDNFGFGNNIFFPQPRKENINQIIDNVTLTRGNHLIKFGIDFQDIYLPKGGTKLPLVANGQALFQALDFAKITGIAGLPFFTTLQAFNPSLRTPAQIAFLNMLSSIVPTLYPDFPAGVNFAQIALPATCTQGFGDPTVQGSTKLLAGFIQDDIKLAPNLLLKAGLRYDLNRIFSTPSNDGNFSPRLALSYNPGRLANLHIHASYGIFFNVISPTAATIAQLLDGQKYRFVNLLFPYSTLLYSMPNHRLPQSDQYPPSFPFVPALNLTEPFDPNFRNSYTHQASLGFDYAINGKTEASISYNYVRGI
jgi:hypothetical protein